MDSKAGLLLSCIGACCAFMVTKMPLFIDAAVTLKTGYEIEDCQTLFFEDLSNYVGGRSHAEDLTCDDLDAMQKVLENRIDQKLYQSL